MDKSKYQEALDFINVNKTSKTEEKYKNLSYNEWDELYKNCVLILQELIDKEAYDRDELYNTFAEAIESDIREKPTLQFRQKTLVDYLIEKIENEFEGDEDEDY